VIALVLGLIAVAASVSPWADAAVDRSLTAHMVQHLTLTMVAAPLLVLGRDVVLRLLPRVVARTLVRSTNAVVGVLAFSGGQLVVHFTGFFAYAESHWWAHVGEHAILLVTALMLWAPVVAELKAWVLLAAMPVMGVVGAVLLAEDRPRYDEYTSIADQHHAGAVMWVVGSLVMVAAGVIAAWRWLRREERRALAREAYGR
jgi:cytochrome c oxidase assembly factor CtaG